MLLLLLIFAILAIDVAVDIEVGEGFGSSLCSVKLVLPVATE